MQTSKEQQDDFALAFTNPFYALLLVVWPWHPRAKRFQRNQATVWKVTYSVCACLRCSHTHSSSCAAQLFLSQQGNNQPNVTSELWG